MSDASFLGDQIVYAVAVEGGTTVLAKERNTGAGGLRAAGARVSLDWALDAPVLIGGR